MFGNFQFYSRLSKRRGYYHGSHKGDFQFYSRLSTILDVGCADALFYLSIL
ncbi:hypothetical protein J5U21_01775 [Saccharolobus shibatae]|uniref:Uncharacterized protein n=1 Tax=Saccharolobus shibatae TaxID=2286 RepID=A0A8F5BVJ9_9CREN|nr:hypothetical protein J5U21_01775 [Saccharolobus shibatae]